MIVSRANNYFPRKSRKDLWDHCLKVAKNLVNLFYKQIFYFLFIINMFACHCLKFTLFLPFLPFPSIVLAFATVSGATLPFIIYPLEILHTISKI